MTQALKENPLWRCKVGGPECMLKILLVIQYFCWFSPITSHDCVVILSFSLVIYFSLELLMDNLQEFGIFKYLLWPKFSQILQKCSTKNKVSNHPTPRFPGQTNHCLLLIASLSTLGRSFKGAQPVHSVPEDCDGKKHFGTNVSSMTKGYKRLSWMCTPVSIW